MELKADPTRVLMSETLKGQLPDIDDSVYDTVANGGVYIVIDRYVAGQQLPLSGVVRSILFDEQPEIEMRVELEEALRLAMGNDVVFKNIELQHGEKTTVPVPGPFVIKALRIQEIDVPNQLCVLLMQLQRVKKA